MNRKNHINIISFMFFSLINNSPVLKRKLWQKWYNLLARHDSHELLASMNYGYVEPHQNVQTKPQFELYEHILQGIQMAGKNVIEVGSGRGGGASYIAKKYKPRLYVGIDIASAACINSVNNDNDTLNFVSGDALALPFQPNSADIVINVESSHCYSDLELFIKQVSTLLVSDGYFCYCDLMPAGKVDSVLKYLKDNNLSVLEYRDITKNVLLSLDQCTLDHSNKIKKNVPWYLRGAFSDFAGIQDTGVYNLFKSGKYSYYSVLAQKN